MGYAYGMKQLSRFAAIAAGLTLIGTSFGQVAAFQASPSYMWGAGSVLPAPYTTQDMTVETRIRVGLFWIPYNNTENIEERVIPKDPGSLNFSINTGDIDPLLPPFQMSLVGTQVNSTAVNWAFDQTFSQTGGFVINQTVNLGGTPTQVNLTLNNVRVRGNLRSNFANVAPFWSPVAMQNMHVRGTHTGLDSENFIDMTPQSVSGTVGGLPVTGLEIRVRRIQHVGHVPFNPVIQGGVVLSDLAGTCNDPVEWALYEPGNPVALATGETDLNNEGQYSIAPSVPLGSYILAMRGRTHLWQASEPITLSQTPATASFTLINGDADRDNEVGGGDLSLISGAFLTSSGDAGFVAAADLDCDGEVGSSDLSVLSGNFLASGWAP